MCIKIYVCTHALLNVRKYSYKKHFRICVYNYCILCIQNGCTPLILAARNGNVDIVRILSTYGADPNLTDLVSEAF